MTGGGAHWRARDYLGLAPKSAIALAAAEALAPERAWGKLPPGGALSPAVRCAGALAKATDLRPRRPPGLGLQRRYAAVGTPCNGRAVIVYCWRG